MMKIAPLRRIPRIDLPARASSPPSGDRHRALLAVSAAIASHRDLHALFHELAGLLHRVLHFDCLALVLYDPATNTMRRHVLEKCAGSPLLAPNDFPPEEGPAGWVWQTRQPLIVANLAEDTRWPWFRAQVQEGIVSLCDLALGGREPAAYDTADAEFLQLVANQVAVAVENALAFESSSRSSCRRRRSTSRRRSAPSTTSRRSSAKVRPWCASSRKSRLSPRRIPPC
jgi:formate hydrogenlyase transcriptional activator